MAKDDLGGLRSLLGRIAEAVGPGTRALEDAMGVGHGRIPQLVNGRRLLRASHLIGLADFLQIDPAELFDAGYPEGRRRARRKLADWVGSPTPFAAKAAAASEIAPELEAKIRAIAREEIAAERKLHGGSGK